MKTVTIPKVLAIRAGIKTGDILTFDGNVTGDIAGKADPNEKFIAAIGHTIGNTNKPA